jgi:hypothetical protein
MFTGLAKLTLFGLGLTPTLLSVLIAGVMLGKPQPCQTQPCVPKAYGAEVLILPLGPLLSLACGYLMGRTGATRPAKVRESEPSRVSVLTGYPEGGSDGAA